MTNQQYNMELAKSAALAAVSAVFSQLPQTP